MSPAVAGLSFYEIRWRTKLNPESIIKVRSGLFSFVLFFFIKQKCVKSVYVNRCLFIRGSRRLPAPPEGLVCATKLHGAKIDGPAVAGLSFFAIRWRTKLHPETIIKGRSGLFSFVLISFDLTKNALKVSA